MISRFFETHCLFCGKLFIFLFRYFECKSESNSQQANIEKKECVTEIFIIILKHSKIQDYLDQNDLYYNVSSLMWGRIMVMRIKKEIDKWKKMKFQSTLIQFRKSWIHLSLFYIYIYI